MMIPLLLAALLQAALAPQVAPTPQAAPAPEAPPAMPPGVIGAPAGTGRYPAVAEVDAAFPDHTLYHPATLPAGRMPIVLWGNGGCRDNGLSAAQFLREVASHGYFIVAVGHARAERPAGLPPALVPVPPTPVVFAGPGAGVDETQAAQVIEGLNRALAENARLGSPYRAKLDPSRIAVMGHSCGGLQAIAASADPRVKTSIIWSSGIYDRGVAGSRDGIAIEKSALTRIHAPIAYINGGPSDIAYSAALDDYQRIAAPALFAWISVGHGGTFAAANGGEYGTVGVAWLHWQLRGDAKARTVFVGPACTLCRDPRWTVTSKRLK